MNWKRKLERNWGRLGMKYDENSLYNVKSSVEGKRCSLFDLATWKNGLAFKKINFSETGVPVIKIAELNNGIGGTTAYTQQKFSEDVHLNKGDLLFSWSGNPQTSIDIFRFNLEEGWLNQHIFKVTPDENVVDRNYFYFLMKNLKMYFTQIATNKQTTGLGHVTIADIKRMSVIIPSIDMQRKIVSYIKPIDDKILLNNDINNNLLVQVQLQFEQIYSKGVLSKISDLVSEIESGSRPKGGALTSGIPSIGAEKIERFGFYDYSSEKYISEEYFVKLKRGIVHSSDVLLYKDGAYTGKVSMALDDFPHAKCAVNEHVFILRTKEYKYQSYLYCCLAKKEIRDTVFALGSSKAAQPGLNKNEILGIEINIPNQIELLDFEGFASPIMRLVAENAKQNRELSNLRDSLLPKLMSGELDVSNIDF